LQFISMF